MRRIAVCGRRPLLLAALTLLAACTAPADHPSLQSMQLPPLLQAHRFAYRPEAQRSYQLSPGGGKLAWVGPHYWRSALFVRNNSTGEVRRYPMMTGAFQWTPDGRRLLSTAADTSGAENTHVYMLDTDDPSAQVVNLTPYPGVKASIHQVLAKDPSQLLVYHNRRDRKLFDLYRIDLNTRKETLVAQNPGDGVAPLTSSDGKFAGWRQSREAQRSAAERSTPRVARQPQLLREHGETSIPLGGSPDGTVVWVLSNRGRDRAALLAVSPKMQWEKVVHEDATVDVSSVIMSRVTRTPLIAYTTPGLPQTTILDAALRADLDGLLKAQGEAPFALEIVSTDAAENHLVVTIYNSSMRRYYLVERPRRAYTLLAEDAPADMAQALATMQPVSLESRDGLPLHGYLTLPRGVQAKRLPMVLLVHGGPWQRSGNPFRSEDADNAQFLANRGYAVLQIDFRGSTGYGKRHATAAIGEFAGKMQDDLHDAVRWAVEQGIADAERVAIMGWSYGGYAALVGMSMTPKAFVCGISLAGPTDLATLIESFPPYWRADLSMWHDYVGNPAVAQDREEMTRKSPLTHAARVERPVLIVHGAKDVRVRIDQSERMVAALRGAGKPVEYLPIADMGHGSGWWVHRLAFLRKSEGFLQRCLGGRASRFDWFEPVAWAWQRVSK